MRYYHKNSSLLWESNAPRLVYKPIKTVSVILPRVKSQTILLQVLFLLWYLSPRSRLSCA